ncbi:MAG: hypothetical protein PVG24_06195 [Gammaproteobacteria bacterium]|jgi:hypothetical protein
MLDQTARVITFTRRPIRVPESMRCAGSQTERKFFDSVRRGNAAYVENVPLPARCLWVRDEERRMAASRRWRDMPIRKLGELYVIARNS